MFKNLFNVDSYADLKTVVDALGGPSWVFYRFTNSGASIQIWVFANAAAVGSSNINSDTPSQQDLLNDFPAAIALTASFSPSL